MAPPAGQIRPGRYLAVFALIVVVLYALVFFTGGGKPTPKLGIDLQGGTQVTLTARSPDGKPPPQQSLDQARQIIEARVNGLGVSGAEVVLNGNNVVITVPGARGDEARSLGQTAKLGFRKVIDAEPVQQAPATPPPAKPSAPNSPPPSAPPAGGQQPSVAPSRPPQGMPAPSGNGDLTVPQAAGQAAPSPAPPTPTPTPTPGGDQSVDPRVAQEIQQAKALRQSTDQQVQAQALALLNCGPGHRDPLAGNDDPNLPLVTCSQDGKEKYVLDKVFLKGEEIGNASAGPNPQGAGYVVNLNFKPAGTKTWADFTSANVGQRAAFVLDTQVVSAPSINEPILGGNTMISGQFNQTQAQQLANVLNYGSLPLSFDQSDAQTVSATLGLASLKAGLLAGAIGLALVVVYCLFYYRALGVLTVLSLALSGITVYAVLVLLGRWIGFTLDLAGIAGFIVAIGITADSFVVFFERLKDEVREGRTFRSAVPRAWVRARRTILSADAVSFLASAVLYVLAVGQVRGFAFTLGMSTVLDLLVVFLVTHPLVVFASRNKKLSSPRFSGLGAVQRLAAAKRAAGRATGAAAVKEV
ncbi:protein translocase subunit SecD [Gandjariella thermophila]|uniref:Protein translocase subunit SecD n=1 Tax=Gandjariella thermophila TaxID=1931992 RepID=A0A4D4J2S4_9PSEU|nr:protein translocase subunit SecD [Gandjariella thermophila]GDY28806.1 protein translocase subunit SecD [Gandjariella thermophila]